MLLLGFFDADGDAEVAKKDDYFSLGQLDGGRGIHAACCSRISKCTSPRRVGPCFFKGRPEYETN